MIELTTDPIDPQALLARVSSPAAGAVLLFLGTVREMTGDRQTARLEYEAYEPMAGKKLAELVAAAQSRWPLVGCAVLHRLGSLKLGEVSVAVAVSSPHRAEAFEAGRWLIDTIKQVVPIWKKEFWSDGQTDWVHPGLDPVRPASRAGPTLEPRSPSGREPH
ncbi:MAG TPA: molybdenum cofactor biosynthesis protein MoaE [Pirellulales bacterium]|nr:molybdenum cofactor biosynthesis protein MoaE [Pirellulales bacterium]